MRQSKVVYTPFVRKYRAQAYRLSRHKDGLNPARGVFWGLLIVLPFWATVVWLLWR